MTIVVGYTPTPLGEAAAATAIAEAARRQAELVVVNSSHGDAAVDPKFAGPATLATLRAAIEAAGVTHHLTQSLSGLDPAESILRTAREYDADLIVIGVRHRTPVGKLLLGSTAQRVILDAECPVLAVKQAQG
ncbi:MAG: universal stress protein [Propionibacteriales bacterium]|nr:universal stress protein [Propionibacteriales bacterium]